MARLTFGQGSFTHELWLLGGQLVDRPNNAQIEFVNAGAVTLEAVDPNGNVKSSFTNQNAHGGWNGFAIDVDHGIGHKYKLRLVNASPNKKEVKQGEIYTID